MMKGTSTISLGTLLLMQITLLAVVFSALATNAGKVKSITLLGSTEAISFTQNETGLQIIFPVEKFGENGWTLKIEGITL